MLFRSKTPGQLEILACAHWLESEIEAVRPAAIVALGATAARALTGRAVKVMTERGRWQPREDGRRVLVTLHPSALLRGEPASRERDFEAWVKDLAVASTAIVASEGTVADRHAQASPPRTGPSARMPASSARAAVHRKPLAPRARAP